MTKKILLIIGILAVIGVALFLVFGSKPQTAGEEGGGFSIRDYLPFGSSPDAGPSASTAETNNEEQNLPSVPTNGKVPRLRKISSEPVAGAVIFNIAATKTASGTSAVRFVEKGTGNVYEAKSDSNAITRLTNTTIPKIVRAFWLPNGSGFLAQTIIPESEIIETSFVKLNKNAASSSVESLTPFGTTIGKLPTGIKEIAISPDGAKVFYYTVSGSSNWFISNPDGTNATSLMSHSLTEWSPKWISANSIIMNTKGSFAATSYSYSFDVPSKTLKKIGIAESGISSKTNTLPEKCVQTKEKNPTFYCAVPSQLPAGNYPDSWYKGLVATEDFIEKMDLNNDIFYGVADLSDLSGQQIDVVDPALSPDGSHLIFRNKIDGYLWMLRIEE